MWGGQESNPGHSADKQRHRPPQEPITPYTNLLNPGNMLYAYILCYNEPRYNGPSIQRTVFGVP